MSTCRWIRCMVLLSVLGLFVSEARTEPMLLIEITDDSTTQRNFSGEPVYLAFLTEDSSGIERHALGGTYDTDDVGMTFEANPEDLPASKRCLPVAGTGRLTPRLTRRRSRFPPT